MQMPVPVAAASGAGGQGSANNNSGGGGGGTGNNGSNGSSGASGGSSSTSSANTGGIAVGGGGGGGSQTVLYVENRAPEGAACMRAGTNTCQGKLTTSSTCGFAYGCSNNANESNNGHSICASLGGASTETGYWTWQCNGIPNKVFNVNGGVGS